jgi:hypothetical protein
MSRVIMSSLSSLRTTIGPPKRLRKIKDDDDDSDGDGDDDGRNDEDNDDHHDASGDAQPAEDITQSSTALNSSALVIEPRTGTCLLHALMAFHSQTFAPSPGNSSSEIMIFHGRLRQQRPIVDRLILACMCCQPFKMAFARLYATMYFRLNFNRGSRSSSVSSHDHATPNSCLPNAYVAADADSDAADAGDPTATPPNMNMFHGLSVQIMSVKSLRPLFAQLELPSAAMRGLASEIRHARMSTSSSSKPSSSVAAAAAAQSTVSFTDWMLSEDVVVNGAFSQAMRDIVSVLSHKEECLVCMHQPTFWASMAELYFELHLSCLPLEHNRFFDVENSIDRDDHPFHTSINFCRQIIQSTLILCCHALPIAPPPSLSSAIRSAIESHVVPLCASAAAAAHDTKEDDAAVAKAQVVGGAGASKAKSNKAGLSAPAPYPPSPQRHRLAQMLPMHLLLGSMLQILGKIEHQKISDTPITLYRSSTSLWLLNLFRAQQRERPQHLTVAPWNAFMRQLFRFFAGLAELQVIALRCKLLMTLFHH